MTKLSVNLNKIALLRNSRGRDFPSVVDFGEHAITAGADGLTIHPRPDQRHARYEDIASLKTLCDAHAVELNIEGYPTPEFLAACIQHRVHQVTLVPDAPEQITSDHGWTVSAHQDMLMPILAQLRAVGIRSSLFMDVDADEIRLAKHVGADRIELHTESYARHFEKGNFSDNLAQFARAYQVAVEAGLGVNAGHDLNLANLPDFLRRVPVNEVSIGHALTVEALQHGWTTTIQRYHAICHAAKAE